MELGIVSIASITVIAYLAGFTFKTATSESYHKWIPCICGSLGLILGIVAFLIKMPEFPAADVINAMAIGAVSGLAATGIHQIGHQLFTSETKSLKGDE